jgi:magnesium transporter
MATELDLCQAFADRHPGDAALLLERLPVADAAELLDALPPKTSVHMFDQMTPSAAAECLARMQPASAATLLSDLRTDLAAALLRRVDDRTCSALLERMPGAEAGVLATVLRYPEGTAGALMDPKVLAVADHVTAGEALARVRRAPGNLLHYLYVVDRTGRLVGVVDLRELMLARPSEPLAGVMHRSVARLTASTTRPAILAHEGWRRVHALPVVDQSGVLLGAVRYQTFRRLDDEAREQARGADTVAAVFALGELYWLGLSGLLDGLASVIKRMPPGAGGEEAGRGNS